MILVDTNVWIDYLRGMHYSLALEYLLEKKEVIMHPLVLGELCVGNIEKPRDAILAELKKVSSIEYEFDFDQLREFTELNKLFSTGLSVIDIELLHFCVDFKHLLWTHDKTLLRFASKMNLEFRAHSS